MKRAIPLWRAKVAEHGDEEGGAEWARAECEWYHCPSCGKPQFRGAQLCRKCKMPVAEGLDGSYEGPREENRDKDRSPRPPNAAEKTRKRGRAHKSSNAFFLAFVRSSSLCCMRGLKK